MDKEQLKQERDARVEKAIALEEPDRIPFVPKVSGFYMYGYDISFYDVMKDARNMEKGLKSFLKDYEPDAVNLGGIYGMDSLELLDTQYLRWPGPKHGLPLDSSFQHLDGEYLHDEEYSEFIQDPTHFTITKLMPRKFKNLQGLSKLYLREVYDAGFYADLSIFDDPEVKEALLTLMQVGKAGRQRAEQMGQIRSWIAEEGFSTYCQGTYFIPFDAFADSVRGIIRTCMDINEFPEELEQAVRKIQEMNVERLVKIYKGRGAKRIFLPLHCGVDEFMSPKAYETYYWPCLKHSIMTIIENGMTPVCFCEGNYNTRLDVISDVPKGKVVYMFEKVDIKRVKETVGKVACICGTVPNAALAFGSVEDVIKETRRQIDILAPGGGFIMDCSIMLDNAEHPNMKAWRETTLKYGQY